MKLTMINGSPKHKDSASGAILSMLREDLGQEVTEYSWNKMQAEESQIQEVVESDAIVIAFPLYIDSIPSHLLRCLIQVEEYTKLHHSQKETSVYVIVNNGFFQGKQNIPAIEVMEHWARRCGFLFGQAIGIGGGGMITSIKSIPAGHGPKKNITLALNELGRNIMERKSGSIRVIEPNYPALAYKWQAEHGWRMLAKKNGLKRRDLGRQW